MGLLLLWLFLFSLVKPKKLIEGVKWPIWNERKPWMGHSHCRSDIEIVIEHLCLAVWCQTHFSELMMIYLRLKIVVSCIFFLFIHLYFFITSSYHSNYHYVGVLHIFVNEQSNKWVNGVIWYNFKYFIELDWLSEGDWHEKYFLLFMTVLD